MVVGSGTSSLEMLFFGPWILDFSEVLVKLIQIDEFYLILFLRLAPENRITKLMYFIVIT